MFFVLFLEAVGLREYCCIWQSKIGWQLFQLCIASSSRATRASRATNLRSSGLVALGLAQSRQSYVRGVAESRQSYSRRRRCWQNGIDNARYCCRVIHAAGERS